MPTFNRIAIVGTTGSGKTTLAKQLSLHFNLEHIELDELHFAENWQEVPTEIFRQRVAEATNKPQWITDGNYSILRDIVWQKAEVIIWLNFPFTVNFSRLLRRTLHRVVSRKPLWHGNKESLTTLFSKDSIILWFFKTYTLNKQRYPALFNQPHHQHLKVLQINRPKQAFELAVAFLQQTPAQ